MKTCTKCGETKPLDVFARRDSDTYRGHCKMCGREKFARYRENNKEKIAVASKRYRDGNKEKIAATERQWAKTHPDKVLEKGRRFREKNAAKIAERQRLRYAASPEKFRERSRAITKEQHRARNEKNTLQLAKSYVAGALRMRVTEIPPELFKLKREQLALHRLGKQVKAFIKTRTESK